MLCRRLPHVVLAALAIAAPALAQQSTTYTPPRTVDGHPDMQGVWMTGFVTMIERPNGVDGLVVGDEEAQRVAAAILEQFPSVYDPQLDWDGVGALAKVRAEYRTSLIVDPPDGRIPYTQAGIELVARIRARNQTAFDNPEERPLVERCMESLGYAPIRTVPILFPRQILQTRDYVLILSEDALGLRTIHLEETNRPSELRSVAGYSTGRWDGDTLVVRTSHLRAEDPARFNLGRPIVLSPETAITERFTRVSETELLYRFTVEDDELYTEPWTGEFSMTRSNTPLYEYACHEGNYSLPAELRGGQMEAAASAR